MRKTQPIYEKTEGKRRDALWINRRDQGTLLVVLACCLAATSASWWYQGGHRGNLIEIDRASPLQASYVVDINTALWPEVIQLPGLGKILAQRILADRQENGPFRDLEDLQRVSGIGPRTLERIRPYLLPIPRDTDWAALDDPSSNSVQ